MFLLALALAVPTALTETHQRDISCVVEIAVLADAQKRGVAGGIDVQASGRRWAGIVGDRIMAETGQPRELVAVAMTEAATARAGRRVADDAAVVACARQMISELAIAEAANAPLPKPERSK
ncbi:MAG: hypothetical protein IBJ12_08195 [Sphingomonadaceae bacterium]|nr:hypothetical protein [Sphingomonadaceae bacterium]